MTNIKSVEEFTQEVLKAAKYITGEGQYSEGSDGQNDYRQGFTDALAMVNIELTGTPKSRGKLTQRDQQIREEERRRVCEVVEGMRKYEIGPGARVIPGEKDYNQALTDAQEAIKSNQPHQ